ncbi:hypothetical protein QJQ45_024940, partial [Haematococcus lacustris]
AYEERRSVSRIGEGRTVLDPRLLKGGGKSRIGQPACVRTRTGPNSNQRPVLPQAQLTKLVFFAKLALAVVYGVASGVLPLHGWPCLAGFGLLSYITPFLIYNSILQLDPEEFGGHAELLNEGQMPALGAFLLSWILTYNALL